jgi:tRNA threonylcarbamoyladenosine biosynthesis protein TsaB
MKIVALETATRKGSCALLDGSRLVERDVDLRGAGAVAGLAALLRDEGVAPRDVDAVAVSVGPGSFTGVRIGVAAAQGFCLATGAAAVPVGTLEALAWSALGTEWDVEGTPLLPSVDARRGEVYAALYRAAARGAPPVRLWGPEPVSPPSLARRFAELKPAAEGVPGVLLGDGAALLFPRFPPEAGWARPAQLSAAGAGSVARAAADRVAEGRTLTPDELEPVYLRKSDAEIHREERLRQD